MDRVSVKLADLRKHNVRERDYVLLVNPGFAVQTKLPSSYGEASLQEGADYILAEFVRFTDKCVGILGDVNIIDRNGDFISRTTYHFDPKRGFERYVRPTDHSTTDLPIRASDWKEIHVGRNAVFKAVRNNPRTRTFSQQLESLL